MLKTYSCLALAAALLWFTPTHAQVGVRVVAACTTGAAPALGAGSNSGKLTVDVNGKLCTGGSGSGQFPAASTPISGNATGTTGSVVGTLAAAAGKTTYICGFNVSTIGGTASLDPIVAGLIGSSQNYIQTSATAPGMLSQSFNPCMPASAANTAITVTTSAAAGATKVTVNSWGYQQ